MNTARQATENMQYVRRPVAEAAAGHIGWHLMAALVQRAALRGSRSASCADTGRRLT